MGNAEGVETATQAADHCLTHGTALISPFRLNSTWCVNAAVIPSLLPARLVRHSPAAQPKGAFMANETHTRGAVKDPEHDGRLKENREEGTSKGGSHSSGSHSSASSHTQGAVKDPEHDGRLKENRDSGTSKSASHSGGSHASESSGHTPGAVTDPEHDGRLKENRDKGVHKG
jgi:hypothetical protein